jgi:DNA gyrase/topoisomerase IV subunit B
MTKKTVKKEEDEVDDERTFQQKSQLEHVKLRPGMYVGSVQLQTQSMYVYNEEIKKYVLEDMEFSPALIKIFDEILVNATDHHVKYPNKVTRIIITFDIKTGIISVENNGPGIPIIKVETLHDGMILKPQAVFSQFLAGDNFENDTERITGGMNGLGAKATAAFSDVFEIQTYDEKRKQLYTQSFKKGLTVIEEPVIIEEPGEGHTNITFLPNYKLLGYKKYNEKYGESFNKLIEMRAMQTAAFVGKACKIHYNGAEYEFSDENKTCFVEFAETFINNDYGYYSTTLNHKKNKKLNMEIVIGISDGKFRQSSIINGISVYKGGTHIKYLQKQIVEHIMPEIEKLISAVKSQAKIHPTAILNNLFILTKCSVIDPEFSSQCKEELTSSPEIFEPLEFKKSEWPKIWAFIQPYIMETVLGKIKDKSKNRVMRGRLFLTKGIDAKYAGDKKNASDCSLIITEGDSASTLIDAGINHKKTELNSDYYGYYSIQGVPINARRMVNNIEDKKNNTIIRIRNDKLQKNKRFANLVELLGLDYEKKYTIGNPEGNKEFESLRYGRAIVATDADVDGTGQIFGLILNFFTLFWPELIKRGYLKRFNTPIIRAYPSNSKKFVKEFYSAYEYSEWLKNSFNNDDEKAGKEYKIKYFKGLAGNDVSEILPTFNKFETKLNTYDFDEHANTHLETFFGHDTEPRKIALSTPIKVQDIIDCVKSKTVPITKYLLTDLKEFQRDNIIRKLPHVMDGSVPSRRKTLYGARMNKDMSSKEVKVINFTGYVMDKVCYTHGDASLAKTIIKMSQDFLGAKNLPLLTGIGQFGTRKKGGNDAGSPRYIHIQINKVLTNAIFPPIDDFLLKYTYEDGERVEPEYYVPIIPMCVLEHMQIPATGWKVQIWARNYTDVFKNVRKMIKRETTKCKKMGLWLRGNKSDVRIASDGREYMVGKYTYDKKANKVTITELPISVYNVNYIKAVAYEKLQSDKNGKVKSEDTEKPKLIKLFKDMQDYSNYDETTNEDEIRIEFTLADGAMEIIVQKYNDALKNHRLIETQESGKGDDEVKSETTKVAKSNSSKDGENDSDQDPDTISDDVDEIDAMETMAEYKVDPLFDPIEEFFKLKLCLNSSINVIGVNQEVLEVGYYGTVVNIWFEERKRLYRDRIERQLILKKLYIKYLENIIRFTKERNDMKITNSTLEEQFNKILKENKYKKFNKSMLISPKYCPVGELQKQITDTDADYEYIISLTYRMMLKESCIEREKELNKEKKELEEILKDCVEDDKHFIGCKTWLKELDTLEKIINKGVEKGWKTKKVEPLFE